MTNPDKTGYEGLGLHQFHWLAFDYLQVQAMKQTAFGLLNWRAENELEILEHIPEKNIKERVEDVTLSSWKSLPECFESLLSFIASTYSCE
jgi:hypothetical protein